MNENQTNVVDNQRDDSKDIITIDYYDRINKKWIKLDVTKEVARFLHSDSEKTRRQQNRYNYRNLPFDEVFDNDENEKYLVDERQNLEETEEETLEYLKQLREEQEIAIIQNSLSYLTDSQREVVEMAIYENMSYKEMADRLGIDKSSIYSRMRNAKNNIKKFIADTQN